jgi:predicted MFS family arabinose efflux permease
MSIAGSTAAQVPHPTHWDTAYEYKMVLLLTAAFGLVGLDRWILPPLFAASMGADLGLSMADLGNLVGALGLAWGISAIFMGGLSDRVGRRKVLVPAVVLFSCLSVFTGMATSLLGLLLIRAVMGVSEGAVAPVGVAVAVEASHPKRRGMNNGLFQCAFALFGLAIAPIVATQLLRVMSWRGVFALVGIPGLIVAVMIWFTLREPVTVARAPAQPGGAARTAPVQAASFGAMFSHRNVPLAMLALLCAMTGIFVLSAMMPSYLTQVLNLNVQQMGFVTSAIGFGGFLGQFGIPAISDWLGRRRSTFVTFVTAAIFLWIFARTGVNLPLLFVLLFIASFANLGALSVIAGPVAAEAAPLGLIASVAGIVIGAGEIFGGGVAPVIAGHIAKNYGLLYTLYLAMGGQVLGAVFSLFFKETAPRKVGSSGAAETSELDQYEAAHPEGIARDVPR